MIQTGAKNKPAGRLRAAWLVLMGQRVTPQQIIGEWLEYQLIFNDLLERWSAKLAREAKQEKKRQERLEPLSPQLPFAPAPAVDRKTELRRRAFSLSHGGPIPHLKEGTTNEPST